MFFLAKESRRRRKIFQDLAVDLKAKTIENRVSDVKNLIFFACGASFSYYFRYNYTCKIHPRTELLRVFAFKT